MSYDVASPVVSFVIPAHNEEAEIGPTLAALAAAGAALGERFEMLVVDDASTDRTAEIARGHGATVVAVNLRHIAAVRNAGAKAARGRYLIFVDADTRVSPGAIGAAVAALRHGAAGGGGRVRFDGRLPLWARLMLGPMTWVMACLRVGGGCFLFARRAVFDAIGGFDERYFASEEYHFSRAVGARGRFVYVYHPVVTSGRKLRQYSGWHILGQFLRYAREGEAALRRREGLELWYDSPRDAASGGV